jgi:hypothetical protein
MPARHEKTPRKQKVGGKLYPLNMRTTYELRRALEAAASTSGRSLAQEVEHRLDRSFLYEDQFAELQSRIRELELRADEDRKTISRQSAAHEVASAVLASLMVKTLQKTVPQYDPSMSDQDRKLLFEVFQGMITEGSMSRVKELSAVKELLEAAGAPSSEQSEGGAK